MSSSPRDERAQPTFPIERRNLGSDVYRVLRDRILKRQMHPGEKLSDLRLSAELGVSRTPIREALHQLVQDGVVVAEPNRGFFVATFTPQDLEEIFDLRCALEAYAMRKVAQQDYARHYRIALDELDRISTLIADADTDDKRLAAASAFLEVDQGFHRWMVEHARQVVDQREVDPLRAERDREPAVADREVVGMAGARQQVADAGVEDAAPLHDAVSVACCPASTAARWSSVIRSRRPGAGRLKITCPEG